MSTSAPSVPLPKAQDRDDATIGRSSKPPVWSLDAAEDSAANLPGGSGSNSNTSLTIPLPAKCDRHGREGGVCCKELKEQDERTLIDPDVVRDVIIGLSDGLTVPFALTAGLSSLGESRLVVLGGIAELIAGAISMGIGGFLASQSERDHYRYLRHFTALRVKRSCAGEMEREVLDVLGKVGVDERACREVARCLMDSEEMQPENEPSASNVSVGRRHSRDATVVPDEEQTGTMERWSKEVGMTAFLMKFGEGMEEVPDARLYISAFTIGMGYLIGGIIPLLPYFFIPRAHIALIYSCVVTGIVLLVFGAVKARVTGAGLGWKGYVWGAFSTLCVGGAAAAAAFGIVRALEGSE